MKKRWIALLSLLVAESYATPIAVFVTGTADKSAMGYNAGDNYTFTWVVNDGYTGNYLDHFDPGRVSWQVNNTDAPPLWTLVSGDGLVGTYRHVREEYNWNEMFASSEGFGCQASSGPAMGLTVNGVSVWQVVARGLNIGTLEYSDYTFVNPATWLSNYVGTYAQSGGSITVLTQTVNESGETVNAVFTPTSVTIAAVPEPATALSLLLGGLIITGYRRIRKAYGL